MRKPKLDDLVPRDGQILTGPHVMLIGDPAWLAWHEVRKVEHYHLSVDALRSQPGGRTGA